MLLRNDFPFFRHHPDAVYLDNAATTHKPSGVIDAMSTFYERDYTSIYRGIYQSAETAALRYELVREQVAQFIGARASDIVFTSGASESIAVVAVAWARRRLVAGDEIVLTELEHHANIAPWQALAQELGCLIRWISVDAQGTLDPDQAFACITQRTKLVACTLSSNVLGDIDQLVSGDSYKQHSFVQDLIERAHSVGARVLLDAAQYAPHKKIQVYELAADFMVFSAHKMLGPQGIGVLYACPGVQSEMGPYQPGGGAVSSVTKHGFELRPFPHGLEAGTPAVATVIGFGAALDYLTSHVDFDCMAAHERVLCEQLRAGLAMISGIQILGPDTVVDHIVSFYHTSIHAHDIAAYCDQHNIAVRAGNHCAQPLHHALGIAGSVRASFYGYNTVGDVDRLLEVLRAL